MSTPNPFDVIIEKLEKLQTSVDDVITKQLAEKDEPERIYSEDFLTLPDLAAILKKPVGTVRGYVHSKGLPAKKMGKAYLIKRLEFNKWLAQWLAQNPKEEIVPSVGYAQMLEHRRKFGRKS